MGDGGKLERGIGGKGQGEGQGEGKENRGKKSEERGEEKSLQKTKKKKRFHKSCTLSLPQSFLFPLHPPAPPGSLPHPLSPSLFPSPRPPSSRPHHKHPTLLGISCRRTLCFPLCFLAHSLSNATILGGWLLNTGWCGGGDGEKFVVGGELVGGGGG